MAKKEIDTGDVLRITGLLSNPSTDTRLVNRDLTDFKVLQPQLEAPIEKITPL